MIFIYFGFVFVLLDGGRAFICIGAGVWCLNLLICVCLCLLLFICLGCVLPVRLLFCGMLFNFGEFVVIYCRTLWFV